MFIDERNAESKEISIHSLLSSHTVSLSHLSLFKLLSRFIWSSVLFTCSCPPFDLAAGPVNDLMDLLFKIFGYIYNSQEFGRN